MSQDKPLESKTYELSKLDRYKAANFQEIYINHTNVTRTFYDMRLIFAQVLAYPDKAPIIEDRASITMTWEHVRPLRDLLSRMLEEYEKENGDTIRKMTRAEPPQGE